MDWSLSLPLGKSPMAWTCSFPMQNCVNDWPRDAGVRVVNFSMKRNWQRVCWNNMRIALRSIMMPHIRGGAEILVDDRAEQLQVHGHEVMLFRLPFPMSFEAPLVA